MLKLALSLMKDLKYLSAYSIPIVTLLALYFRGYYSFITPIYAFLLIPVFEIILPQDTSNIEDSERQEKSKNIFFDFILYLNVPIIFGILYYAFHLVAYANMETYEIIGIAFSAGIALGSNGINVAHELGHRQNKLAQFTSKLLLLPSLYMHFYIEHNFGHHLHAATPEDPATAKYNQSIYSFWITSVRGQYRSAWKIQRHLLNKSSLSFLAIKNDMLWYILFQIGYLLTVFLLFGMKTLAVALAIAVISFLLLETINYIEHYGLMRKKLPSGRYERVKEIHSWNSNHIIGRIILYELTRHSDHHYKSSKKYQLLDYHDISPQMPYGYPTSLVLSLFPPLWFKIMNKRIPQEMKGHF